MPRGRKPKIKVDKKEIIKKLENDLNKKDITKNRISKSKFTSINDKIIQAVENDDLDTWFNHISEFIVLLVKFNKGEPTKNVNVSKSMNYKGIASSVAYFNNNFYSIFVSFLPHKDFNIYFSKYLDGGFTEPIKMCYNKNIEEYKIKEVL